jgi:hypothetical protein
MTKPGRNDPCHCGSGKKYKKCHLESDERGERREYEARTQTVNTEAPADMRAAKPDIKRLTEMMRELSRRGPAADRGEFAKLLAESETVMEYLARQEEIDAAAAELESHLAEFDEFAADEDRFAEFSREVFTGDSFAPLRFTAAEVQRAFEQVGHPGSLVSDDKTVETLRAAILHLADKERRSNLAMQLVLRLPEAVAAGRFLEAWLLQSCSFETGENPDKPNLFLFRMFAFGYDAWAAQKRSKDASLIRQLGFDLDKLRGMSLDELDAFVQSHASDPAQSAALDAFFDKHPHLREESVANLDAMRRNSAKLLEREDGRCLLLTIEEVRPWMALFNERCNHGR